MLKQTNPGIYHGYVVELEQLSEEMKTVLIRSKLIHPKLLKIYWPSWSL